MPFPLIPLLGLVGPPLFDLGKKLILGPSKDTPEATASALATTKPEVLPEYVKATVSLKDAEVRFFNRDVIGAASQWIVDLRASIRPVVTGLCALALLADVFAGIALTETARDMSWTVVNMWFGQRLTSNGK